MTQSAKGASAFEPGRYDGFTGYINYAGTEGYVENASFELLPGLDIFEKYHGITKRKGRANSERLSMFEHVHWHSGRWLGGIWDYGEWDDGEWMGGTWLNGLWRRGTWHDGVWHDGWWLEGTWLKGEWLNGLRRSVTENPDGTKTVGFYNPDTMKRITSLELMK